MIKEDDPMLRDLARILETKLPILLTVKRSDTCEAIRAILNTREAWAQARREDNVEAIQIALQQIAKTANITVAELNPTRRRRRGSGDLAMARHAAIYAVKEITGSASAAARIFRIDRSTVKHSCDKALEMSKILMLARVAIAEANSRTKGAST